MTHLPREHRWSATLWQTSYGKAILVKVGLLCLALVLGGLNLARTSPRLVAADERKDAELGASGAGLLRRNVTGEVLIMTTDGVDAHFQFALPKLETLQEAADDILRRFSSGADDALVVMLRYRGAPA